MIKNRIVKVLVCSTVLFSASHSWANEHEGVNSKHHGHGAHDSWANHGVTVYGAADITKVKDISDAGVGFQIGAKYSYFFSQNVGLFIGGDYARRKVSMSGNTGDLTLPAIDIPVGLTFRFKGLKYAEHGVFMGAYYALPLEGTFKVPEVADATVKGKGNFGLLIQSDNYFPVTPGFDLGFFSAFKYGFGDAISEVSPTAATLKEQVAATSTAYNISIGFVGRF